MKVLHIVEAFAGGVLTYLKTLVNGLDETYQCYILYARRSETPDDLDSIFGKAILIESKYLTREINLLRDVAALAETRNIIKEINPDIVYAHSSKAGTIARLANVGLKSSCIYNPHGWAFNMTGSRQKQRVYAALERSMAPLCDRIICISHTEKRSALKNGVGRENQITVIQNGINIDLHPCRTNLQVNREKLNIPQEAFVVGMVGRLARQKAPDVFVYMAKQVLENIPDAYFLMVGDGDMREEMEALIQSLGLADRFRLTGWVDNPREYVDLFDVAVLLSRWEGFGLVIPEYMLAKKPIVAAAVDAIPELIQDRVNGLLVTAEDPAGACGAVCELYQDQVLRENLIRQGALDVYEKYDAKRVVEAHMRLFQQLKLAKGR